MDAQTAFECEWPYLRAFFPPTPALDASALGFRAIVRRRAVDEAETLLRIALAYGFCGLSLRQTAAWAETLGVASLSDVALLKRLRNAADWLGHLLGVKLAERSGMLPSDLPFRLRLVDATAISRVGSSGTDWRVHLSFNLASLSIDHIQLTDHSGGESLTRFPVAAGDLIIGDRGYAHRAGFHAIRRSHADFLVRLNWQNVPLLDPTGAPFDLLQALRSIPDAQATSFQVQIAPNPRAHLPAMPARLVALRKSEAAAEQSRRKVLEERSRKSRNVDPRTLESAGYVFVLTSAEEAKLPATQALELYRFRWQIELLFKRLKGLSELGNLPAKDSNLARSMLYAKLLAALVLDDLTRRFLSISPWGYPIRQ